MALPADLFLQAWRPSAYVISGTINWLAMFTVGMLFGYIVVRHQLCTIYDLSRKKLLMSWNADSILEKETNGSLTVWFYVSTQDGLGQFCFLIFVVYSIFSAGFLLYFVPETKGKTMVEIMADFNKLNYKNRSADTDKTDINLATKF